jgi:transcriptional regulator with XRE-family HTH domain
VSEDEVRDLIVRIGQGLREARQERNLSLAQVAASAGVTRAFISQLERGRTTASVSNLYRICAALGIDLRTLLTPTRSRLVRVQDRKPSFFGGSDLVDYLLTPESERRVELIEVDVKPGGCADEELYVREGDLVITHVKRGSLEVRLEGETIMLNEGDTLTYDPRVPHTWRNPSRADETVVLFVDMPARMF